MSTKLDNSPATPTGREFREWVSARCAAIVGKINRGEWSEAVGMLPSDPFPSLNGRTPQLVLAFVLCEIPGDWQRELLRRMGDSIENTRSMYRASELRVPSGVPMEDGEDNQPI